MSQPVGYVELLRQNADFRRLWGGQVISLFGDWFNTLALYRLADELGQSAGAENSSALALAGVLLVKMLPLALASPLAGVLVDRWNRRRTMIGADFVRAAVVLGFLLVNEPGELWLLYTLGAAQIVVSAVFQPAKSASVPNITTPRELLTANALSSATWSVMLAVGAALGGWAVDAFGTDAVFLFDAATYLVSAVFIARARIPQETDAPASGSAWRQATSKIHEGWQHIRATPRIGRIVLSKAAWGLGGGALVYFLVLIGDTLLAGRQSTGIGVLFMARGVGTGIGPILARAWVPERDRWPTLLGLCVALSGVGYLLLGLVDWTLWIMAFVVIAHAASGANWVISTTMLQERTSDRLRGRVIATDWLLVTLAESGSIVVAALLLQYGGMAVRSLVLAFAAMQVLTGLWWQLRIVPAERRADRAASPTRRPAEV